MQRLVPIVVLATLSPANAAVFTSHAVVEPLLMSDVSLQGDWKESERRNQEVLLSLNHTEWACHFTSTANLTSCVVGQSRGCVAQGGVGVPSCSPLPGEMGLGGYYGHYQGHWMSATAFLYNTTGNATIKEAADKNIERLADVMEAWKSKYNVDGYLFPYDPLVWDKLLAGHGAGPYYSVPFYTLHKLMAGLLDQYHYAGNTMAFDLVKRMAQWVHDRVEAVIAGPGGMDLWQEVLLTEWGGMNDVLYNLYMHTGNEMHYKTARRFNGYVFTARLAAGEDDLSLLPFPHANFHLPEVVGMARAYELTGNATDKAIVDTFFDALSSNHSYATAGSNSGECWQAPRDLGNFLDSQTEESCTQYNVLKVARRSFITSASPSKADFYERAILNGIIGNQNRQNSLGPTSYIYMLPLGGVSTKAWMNSDVHFPCCWGTLSESFAKLGDSIFFWQPAAIGKPPALYINQFVAATAKLRKLAGEVSVKQEGSFPVDPNTTSTLTVQGSGEFDIMIRIPKWATGANVVKVNGAAAPGAPYKPETFLRVSNKWKDGDKVELAFPMEFWTNPLNDYHPEHNATLAFMYGPLVLAGIDVASDIWVPKGGTEVAKRSPASFIHRTSSSSLTFEAVSVNGSTMKMLPLKDVMSEKYVVYFMTAGTKPPQPRNGYCPHSRGVTKSMVSSIVI